MDHKTDLAGRIVSASIDFHGQRFQIINVYGPNNHSECEIFFDNLWRFKYPHLEPIVATLIVYRMLHWISGVAMTVLEIELSRSSTLLQNHSL